MVATMWVTQKKKIFQRDVDNSGTERTENEGNTGTVSMESMLTVRWTYLRLDGNGIYMN